MITATIKGGIETFVVTKRSEVSTIRRYFTKAYGCVPSYVTIEIKNKKAKEAL